MLIFCSQLKLSITIIIMRWLVKISIFHAKNFSFKNQLIIKWLNFFYSWKHFPLYEVYGRSLPFMNEDPQMCRRYDYSHSTTNYEDKYMVHGLVFCYTMVLCECWLCWTLKCINSHKCTTLPSNVYKSTKIV